MVKVGDIFEIATPRGLAYFQYTSKDSQYGHLIRILPGIFEARPTSLSTLAATKELYFTYFPLGAAFRQDIVQRVANEPIPQGSEKPRLMRRAGGRRGKKVLNWFLSDGEKEWRVDRLNEDERDLSIKAIWNDTLLIERITEEWLPTHET